MTEPLVLVTGGAGYVGAVLVPHLLTRGYRVRVLDLFIYGERALDSVSGNARLEQRKGDIRDQKLLKEVLRGVDAVIHLACISNDPSFELNPQLSRSINFDAFGPLVKISKESGVSRFIYASTSSVYGVSDAPAVKEDHPLVPITDYNKYKGLCEPILLEEQSSDFTTVVLRPATVCGFSPRQRLDLAVNILTNQAFNMGRVSVFGGEQTRPNIHIQDMVELYSLMLESPAGKIAGQIFNAGNENLKIKEIAEVVVEVVEGARQQPIQVVTTPTDDIRSYRISSEKLHHELGWGPKRAVVDGVRDLVDAFSAGRLPNPLHDIRYYNIRTMQNMKLL